jgi:hypothetical protein
MKRSLRAKIMMWGTRFEITWVKIICVLTSTCIVSILILSLVANQLITCDLDSCNFEASHFVFYLFSLVAKPGISIPQTKEASKFIPHSPKEVSGKFF